MPIKGSTLKIGPRLNPITLKLYQSFVKETKSTISYKSFRDIITRSLISIRGKLINNAMGLKMPYDLGFTVVTRFKPKKAKRAINWKLSKELGTRVFYTNNVLGYKPRINWLTKKISKCRYITIYKFVPDRELDRGVGRALADGKEYNDFGHDHFRQMNINVNYSRLSDG